MWASEYQPYGATLLPGPEPRRGFIDREKDDESGLGDFGARKYDDGIGRFTSIDPLWEKFRAWSPYVYSYNSPVQFVDPSGESAVATVSEDGTTITVRATLVFYGTEATTEKAERIAAAVQRLWNEGGAQGVVINGKKYVVKFEITGLSKTRDEAKAMADKNKIDKNYELNFVRLDIYNDKNMSYCDPPNGSNSGYWRGMPMRGNHMETTPAHEFGHLMGYDSGNETETRIREHDPYNGEGNPSIMANWDGGLAGYGVPNASLGNRKVYPETIGRIFEGKNLSPGSMVKLGVMTNKIHRKGY